MNEIMKGVVCGLVGLGNMVGHWFPWAIWPGIADPKTGRLKRVYAYIHGCGSILAGYAVWAAAYAEMTKPPVVNVWEAWSVVVLLTVSAGIGTVLPRLVEWLRERRHDQQDVADYEQTISSR